MITIPAIDVMSPKDCIDHVHVIYDGGDGSNSPSHYSLAMLTWEGVKCIGIRWNITHREWDNPQKAVGLESCIGEPNSRGYATWFVLPDHFLALLLNGEGDIAVTIKQALEEIGGSAKEG